MLPRWWLFAIAGCGPAVPTDETGGDDGTQGSDEVSGPDATATMTMTGPDTVTDPTLGTTVGTTATTVEPVGCDTEFVSACQAYCATVITCNPEEGIYEECVTGCGEELATETPDCALARCELYACFGTLSCDQLETGSPECNALAGEVAGLCGNDDGACFLSAGPDSCEYGCDGPPSLRIACDLATCTCYRDEIETGSCEAAGICANSDAIEEYGKTCCGW
jgi:hypothetical protein